MSVKFTCPNCGVKIAVATLSEKLVPEPSVAHIKAKRAKADARRVARGIDPVKARLKKLGKL